MLFMGCVYKKKQQKKNYFLSANPPPPNRANLVLVTVKSVKQVHFLHTHTKYKVLPVNNIKYLIITRMPRFLYLKKKQKKQHDVLSS